MNFGDYVRQLRERRLEVNPRYSVRRMAQRIGVEPAYLGKIERGDVSPSEETILRLAADLGEDADYLLALAGKVASDIREIIIRNPILFAELIRGLSDMPESELMVLVRKVRNGEMAGPRRRQPG
jgi:transcriptional regulator with XRE-family HTH domain